MMEFATTQTYIWTNHAKGKMRQYGLSESRVRRIIKSPVRIEEGIAQDTIAFMQPSSYKRVDGERTWNQELWVMAQRVPSEKKKNVIEMKIISAWRYPGKTKEGATLPWDILNEISEGLDAI